LPLRPQPARAGRPLRPPAPRGPRPSGPALHAGGRGVPRPRDPARVRPPGRERLPRPHAGPAHPELPEGIRGPRVPRTRARMILTGPPVVSLRQAPGRPYDSAIAAARTCYMPRVVSPDEITASQRESIGPLTFEGGH